MKQMNELPIGDGPASSAAAALKAVSRHFTPKAKGKGKAAAAAAPASDAAAAASDDGGAADSGAKLPPLLASLAARLEGGDDGGAPASDEARALSEASLRALGLMTQFLSEGLLDSALLPHAAFEPLGGAEVRW
jgi:hypothetical protein